MKSARLKPWFRIPEAAEYLSGVFSETVTPGDILRAALEGDLKLSVRFVNEVPAKRIDDTGSHNDEEVVWLSGVYDLPLAGAERLAVEHEHQQLVDGPRVDLEWNLDDLYVEEPTGLRYAIQQRSLPEGDWRKTVYVGASRLPDYAVLVVRRSALEEVTRESAATTGPAAGTTDAPIGKREKATLLKIIAAACRLPKLDLAQPTRASTLIADETERMGNPVGPRTVLEHLNEAKKFIG